MFVIIFMAGFLFVVGYSKSVGNLNSDGIITSSEEGIEGAVAGAENNNGIDIIGNFAVIDENDGETGIGGKC